MYIVQLYILVYSVQYTESLMCTIPISLERSTLYYLPAHAVSNTAVSLERSTLYYLPAHAVSNTAVSLERSTLHYLPAHAESNTDLYVQVGKN